MALFLINRTDDSEYKLTEALFSLWEKAEKDFKDNNSLVGDYNSNLYYYYAARDKYIKQAIEEFLTLKVNHDQNKEM